jgi:uncharacterized protein (DUF2267 family)
MGEFDRCIEKANVWLADVGDELGVDERTAARMLRTVLHALRDRLPLGEAVQLAAQLPTVIRGVYFDGWQPQRKPLKLSKVELVARVGRELGTSSELDAEDAVHAVMAVLARHVSAGEIGHVMHALPRSMQGLLAFPI